MKRLICLVRGHEGEWSAWTSGVCRAMYRTRFCPRCRREVIEFDGKRK